MARKMVTYIDPEEGYRYGFPKVFPDFVGNVPVWLVENGYPQERIDYWISKNRTIPYRIWTESENADEDWDCRPECYFG